MGYFMSANLLPDWLLAKAARKFLDGEAPDDRASQAALAEFVKTVSEDKKPDAYDVASTLLDDPVRIAELKEKARQKVADEKLADKQAHKTDHESRMEKFHQDHAERNKVNNLISLATNLGTFITGLVMSPLLSILFKHHLSALDKKLHPEDFKSKNEEMPASLFCEQAVLVDDVLSKRDKHHKVMEASAPPLDKDIVPVQNTSYGLRDPKTSESIVEFLEQGKKILLPDGRNVIYLKSPSVPCRTKFVYSAPAVK